MNDILAKRVNDTYLIRCAQILNNKSIIHVEKAEGKDGVERDYFFIKAEGVRISSGGIVPFADGFDSIIFVKNGKSYTIALIGTDFKIDLFATEEKCYYRNKRLQIELKYEEKNIGEDGSINKNYFQLKSPSSTISVSYALNPADIIEIIYYYEMCSYCEESSVENSIVNNNLINRSDEEIEKYMKMLYDAYMEAEPEDLKEEKINLIELQNDSSVPDDIKKMLMQAEKNCEKETQDRTYNEFLVNNSVMPSTFSIERTGELTKLEPRVYDMYLSFYDEVRSDEDFFIKVDLFGKCFSTRDSEIDDIDDGELSEDYYENDSEENNEELEDDTENIEDVCERYKFFSRQKEFPEEDNDDAQEVSLDDEKAQRILKAITEYVILRDFEFSDLFGLIYPMIGVFKEIEDEYYKHVITNNDKDLSDYR